MGKKEVQNKLRDLYLKEKLTTDKNKLKQLKEEILETRKMLTSIIKEEVMEERRGRII